MHPSSYSLLGTSLFIISHLSSSSAQDTTITASASYPSVSVPAPESTPTISGSSGLPLTEYHFDYPNLPEKVNPFAVGRGPQIGYNQCNGSTAGPESLCQTAYVNSLSDFCLWGSPDPDELMGNVEAKTVAYCTKEGYGTRLIPPGALTGVQFMRTSAYVQVVGHIDQRVLGLKIDDLGGELDPHGADHLGNPLGGLMYSNNLTESKDGDKYIQVMNWNNFIGSGTFCFKVCDPKVTEPNYCNNVYDEIGCAYNAPASYKDNEFTECEGDVQLPVGTYVEGGQTHTWYQTRPVGQIPYQAEIPASSNCKTYKSEELYATNGAPSSASTTPTDNPSSSRSNSAGSPEATADSQGSGAVGNMPSWDTSLSMNLLLIVGTIIGGGGLMMIGF